MIVKSPMRMIPLKIVNFNHMEKYSIKQTFMISEIQAESLRKLKNYDVNILQFSQSAFRKNIREDKGKENCPF